VATSFSASPRPTRTRILPIALAIAVLLALGWFTAQRAKSATLTKKAFAGVKVVGTTATLVHPSHVIAVTHSVTGSYKVTFDRHVDNCSLSAAADFHGGSGLIAVFQLENDSINGGSTADEVVLVRNSSNQVFADGDFDVIALCPGT